jgi:hypothetical protein
MADELRPDELQSAWNDQRVDSAQMSSEELRRRAERLERRVRTRLRFAVAMMISLAAGYASFLYFFPGMLHRTGASLTLIGYVYAAYDLYRRGPARKVPAEPAMATCAVYRAELERQRDFCLGAWLRLLAFVPGPVVFIMGFVIPEQSPATAALLAALMITAPFAVGIPVNRLAARKFQREIDSLNALMVQ